MADGLDLESQRREWGEMMADTARADAAAERARRRDMFAAAALTGLLADSTLICSEADFANNAVEYADALLAALDAAAGPTNVEVPPQQPPPMRDEHARESERPCW